MKRFVFIVDDDMIKYLLCNNILITRSFVRSLPSRSGHATKAYEISKPKQR